MQTTESLDPAADRVVRTTLLAGLVPALVVGVALCFVHLLVGLAAFLLIAGGWALLVSARVKGARDRVVAPLGARALVPGSQPRVENLLEGLCVTGGVGQPEVLLIDSDAMNGLVAADREGTTLVLTRGLVEGLGRIELEGAVANLLGRQRDGSARYATLVTALFGSSGRGARLLVSGLGEQRAVRSDLAAVDMTRYPPGLIAALARMESVGTVVRGAPERSIPLWLAPPVAGSDALDANLAATTMQPLTLRIAVLEEL
jgi:heat shock protein HtpX